MVIAAVMPERDAEEVVSIPAVLYTYLTKSDLLISQTTCTQGEIEISMWSLYYIEEWEYVARDFLNLVLTHYANAAVNPPMTQSSTRIEVVWDKSESEASFEYTPWGSTTGFSINTIDVITRYALTNYGEAIVGEKVAWGFRDRSMLITPAVIV